MKENMPRQQERLPISLEIVLESSSGKREARISDLSMGGCFIDTIVNIREGETVGFVLTLSTGQWLHLAGSVVYVLSGFGFGIRFIDISPEQQALLEQVIISHGGTPGTADSTVEDLPQPPVPIAASTGRILLVIGDPANRDLLKGIIEEHGHEALFVTDLSEAYNIFQSDADFRAVIFEILLPDIQELKLVRYMRNESRLQHLPVGILTANQNPALWQESFNAGATTLLPEPFLPEQMRYIFKVLLSQNHP
jgi:CheY-like chemotaxis protein